MKVDGIMEIIRTERLVLRDFEEQTGKQHIAMALPLRLFATWTGDPTLKKKLKSLFNEQ